LLAKKKRDVGCFGCRWKLTPATLIGHELCCGGRSDEEGWSEREKGKEEEKII